jgi:hypothetical protein
MMEFLSALVQLVKSPKDLFVLANAKMMNFWILKETAILAKTIKLFQTDNVFANQAILEDHAEIAF